MDKVLQDVLDQQHGYNAYYVFNTKLPQPSTAMIPDAAADVRQMNCSLWFAVWASGLQPKAHL